jgi:hypothetical protein
LFQEFPDLSGVAKAEVGFGFGLRTHVNSQSVPKDREGGLIRSIVADEDRQRVSGQCREKALGRGTLSHNSARKQLPDSLPLEQTQARPEMITGDKHDLFGAPRRWQLGPTVMDRQGKTLILDLDAGRGREALGEPKLCLTQELFFGRRKCDSTPFPAVKTQQVNAGHFYPLPQIDQLSTAHDVDARSRMSR